MQEFLQKNAWNLLITGGTIIIAFATLSSRVSAVSEDHDQIETRLIKIEDLTERIVRLEEGRQVNANNIEEIKADIKDIKRHFEID